MKKQDKILVVERGIYRFSFNQMLYENGYKNLQHHIVTPGIVDGVEFIETYKIEPFAREFQKM